MKVIITFFIGLWMASVFTAKAYADCTASLRTQNGRLIEEFTEYNCQRARSECQEELRERHREGRNPRAYCQVERDDRNDRDDRYCLNRWWDPYCRDDGRPNSRRAICEYNLISRLGGGILRVYRGVGRTYEEACRRASNECEEHDSGPILTCQRANRFWNSPQE